VCLQVQELESQCQKLQVRCELLEKQLGESERRVVILEAEQNRLTVSTAEQTRTVVLDEEQKRRALVEDLQNAYENKLKALEEVSKAQAKSMAQAEADYKKYETHKRAFIKSFHTDVSSGARQSSRRV
jgi:hypothetical protein